MLAAQELKNVVQSVEVLNGDGNSSFTERFTVVNDQKKKMVKVAKGLEVGCLAIDCFVPIVRFDIIKKINASCIIKSDIAYAVKKEFEVNDPKSHIQLLAATVRIAKRFLESRHNV
ncbi:hypothetical protein CRYUN_Cryun18bG0028600 [Craigia yunnanensis]